MDSILPQLLSFPPHPPPADPLSDAEYDKQIKTIVQILGSLSASKLTGGVRGGGDLLDILDPSINTLPYLYVLLAHIKTPSGKQHGDSVSKLFAPTEPLWQKMMDFMERFDPIQIRYGGNEIRRLIELTATRADQLRQPTLAIAPIRTAILRIDPSGATLTSSHLLLSTLCLSARAFSSALPVLDKDISFLPATSEKQAEAALNILSPYLCSNHDSSSNFITPVSGISDRLTYQDPLQYFLHGGMIYMALKDWGRALFFLEIVIATPGISSRDGSGGVSKIQIEAFKKWVLASLLKQGHISRMPKNISSQATKAYVMLGKPYTALADVFREGIREEESNARLVAEAEYGLARWTDDFNESLVKQVVYSYQRFAVIHLAKAYAALNIADVARRTSPDPSNYVETADYLSQLIATSQLNASISKPSEDVMTWAVRFDNAAGVTLPNNTEEAKYSDLKRLGEKIATLMDDVQETDRQIGLSKEYITDAKRVMKMREAGQGDDENMPLFALHQESFSHDEDMMADL